MIGHDYHEGYYFITINTAPRWNCRASCLVLPHVVVQPFAPVAGLALGVGDGIDDDAIVEFMPTLVPVAFSRQIVI